MAVISKRGILGSGGQSFTPFHEHYAQCLHTDHHISWGCRHYLENQQGGESLSSAERYFPHDSVSPSLLPVHTLRTMDPRRKRGNTCLRTYFFLPTPSSHKQRNRYFSKYVVGQLVVSWCTRRRNCSNSNYLSLFFLSLNSSLILPRKTLISPFLYIWFKLVASMKLLPPSRGNLWECFSIVSKEGGYYWFWWAGVREAKYPTMCGKAPHNKYPVFHASWMSCWIFR